MSLKLPGAPNSGLFKQGYQTHKSEDGAVIRNIAAVREISSMVRTSIGPCGRHKIVVNHLGKVFLTSDAATILRELEIVHPAAKLAVMASQQQESEMGDGTNLVLVLAGALLGHAEELLRLGLNTTEIAEGYDKARKFAVEALNTLQSDKVDFSNEKSLEAAIRTAIMAKQYGNEDILGPLVTRAILCVLEHDAVQSFNVDNVRVVKILGSSLDQSQVVRGMVFGHEPEGAVKNVGRAKVAVFNCPIDISQTETKGTVLLKNAREMMEFSKGEESQVEQSIKDLANTGLRVVVAGAGIGELALHYLNRYNILVFKVSSKFELRRLCRVVQATPLARFGAPMPDELGHVDKIETVEIGGDRVTVFRQDPTTAAKTVTIVVRGATQSRLDDVERAIDDGVSVFKSLARDPRVVAGAGSTEIELAQQITAFGERTPGLLQHVIKKYGQALEVVPRTLAENSGLDAAHVVSYLYAAHASGDVHAGVDVEDGQTSLVDAMSAHIVDSLAAKVSALTLATDAVTTILSVDQIIMAKRAGGPAVPKQSGNWDADD